MEYSEFKLQLSTIYSDYNLELDKLNNQLQELENKRKEIAKRYNLKINALQNTWQKSLKK